MIRLIIKLICFFIPIKSWRKKCRKHIHKYVEYIEYKHIKNNYTQVIKKIKQKAKNNQKIKVAFLVSERQKWNCQQLYEKLEKSNIFEPMVLVTNIKGREKELELNYDFFKNLNINVDWAYKDDEYIDLSVFNIDILFYQQPWEINEKQNIKNTSKLALSMYLHYSVVNEVFAIINWYKCFCKKLFAYFVINNEEKQLLTTVDKNINFVVIGHPKLDVYFDNKEYEKKYIIYAPHHSFEKEGLRYATFEWNGKEILEFAKKHKELNWVFKPHPRFKYSVVSNGILTREECDKYYKDWKEIGLVCDSGNYFDLFKQSKYLITDCYSFLIEYFPTKNPVIVPISKNSKEKTNNLVSNILNSYYKVYNISELSKCLEDIILNNNDYMKNVRLEYLEKYKDIFDTNASQNIINYLIGVINAK